MKCALLLLGLLLVVPSGAQNRAHPNILFIAIDDLRLDVGPGGVRPRTPNLDKLAAQGRSFTRHYVQVPTCGASRAALLRGRYPTKPAHLRNEAIRETHAEWTTSLPSWFARHGYATLALGKIGHYPGGRTGRLWAEGLEELPNAWDRSWIPETPWKTPLQIMHGYANGVARVPGESPALESFDGPDEAYSDAWIATEAVRTLGQLAATKRPWFFGVGFFKPHLPFAAPKRFFDMHDPAESKPPVHAQRPQGASGWHRSGEFRDNYGHGGRDPETDLAYAGELRHAYAAATSYVDAQVGRTLEALDKLGLAEATIVVVWSDHGFLLGEFGIWGKHTLYEEALRAPLIIRTPGMKNPGKPSAAVVETIDLFQTLTQLAKIPTPQGLDGASFRAQVEDPEAASVQPAFGFWTSGQRTIRTDEWRLIAHPGQGEEGRPAIELFKFGGASAGTENVAARYPEVVRNLLRRLDEAPVIER